MKRKNSVKYSLLAMATVPILLLGFLVICISVKRFETSLHAEVESELSGMAYAVSDMLDIVFPGESSKYYIDLKRANEVILISAGIKPENIDNEGICTCCRNDLLFSHRASNGRRGNLAAFIMLKQR